ncbi:MAG TPA: hypothetical protein VFP92_02340 [Rhodanobacteraceae bacterium]|nr:hypothetical protein [Rhodanobacteraceae bacterium]
MHEPGHESAEQLPRHTTPTWEVELLISGVAVFAMLQLPGWLNERLLFLLPRFADSWRGSLITVFSYAMGAAVILAATFAVHLLLRAYWIALVGMYSVYPGGIRWDRLRMGPIEREVMQRRDGDFAALIERADNRASIVFATGVALAMILLVLTVLVGGMFAVGMALVAALRWQVSPENILMVGLAIVMVPLLLIYGLDRKLGVRLREGDPLRRAMAAGFDLYARLGFANRGGILGVLSSHHGRWRVQGIAMGAVAVCIIGALFGQQAMRQPERFGNYAWFPRFDGASASVLDAAHYDDQRDPLRSPVVPFIQSAEIDGNYIRLTVPFKPGDDAAAMQRHCSAVAKIENADVRAAAALRCLAAWHAVTLDGEPLTGFSYEAGSDPRTDRPALVAMIDVRTLVPGRHQLAVARAASTDTGRSGSPGPWIIPFWR